MFVIQIFLCLFVANMPQDQYLTYNIFVWSFYMHYWRHAFHFFFLRYSLSLFIHAWHAVQFGLSAVECMYMLCQGLVCPRINVFEVNYLERLLVGPSSLCVSKSRYWFLRCRINAARNTSHSILVSTWYVPLAPLRLNALKQASKRHLPLLFLFLVLSLFSAVHTQESNKIYHIPSSLL